MVGALLGQREADEAAPEAGHEVDGFGRDVLGRQRQVALVLAIFVVDHHNHAAGADFGHCAGYVGKGRFEVARGLGMADQLLFSPTPATNGKEA